MTEQPDFGYSLGTLDYPNFNLLVDISAEEYESIENALASVVRLKTPFAYKLVERNFLDFKSVLQFATITISLGRKFTTSDHRMLGEAVIASTVNWLTAARLFLDHAETDLKRRFGKTSAEAVTFQKATSTAFDGSVGYRFCSKFRNYVQHCGLPYSHIEVTAVDADAPPGAVQSAAFVLDRDELLEEYDEWGRVRHDLLGMPKSFSLLPLADDAMKALRKIYRILLDRKIDEALERCGVVTDALATIEATGQVGLPAIYQYQYDLERVTHQLFEVDLIRRVSRVAQGHEPRESLFSRPEVQRLKLDPATIKERFHRDNRGVQVLSTWLVEQGGTPRFFGVVNNILREDGSMEPLITGLINVCALLAHMTSGALGTTAEGLVAGLLNEYSGYGSLEDGHPG